MLRPFFRSSGGESWCVRVRTVRYVLELRNPPVPSSAEASRAAAGAVEGVLHLVAHAIEGRRGELESLPVSSHQTEFAFLGDNGPLPHSFYPKRSFAMRDSSQRH